jgi:hypothetical protein
MKQVKPGDAIMSLLSFLDHLSCKESNQLTKDKKHKFLAFSVFAFIKGLGGTMPLFLKFIIFFNIHSYNTYSVHPSPFAEARLLESSSRLRSARGASMGCRAEIRTRACLTAGRRTTN